MFRLGGSFIQTILRLRAGPSVFRRLRHRQGGPVAGVSGGVFGGGIGEARGREMHGGGVQLRRNGGLQTGGALPGAGGFDGGFRFDSGDDRFNQRRDAEPIRVCVVVGALTSEVGDWPEGASLRRRL